MRIPFVIALALATVVAACSSDNTPTSTTTTATGDSATSTSSGLTIIADTNGLGKGVAAGSTVLLKVHVNQGATPQPGVLVIWTVTAGGGSVPGAESTTDSSGTASIGWIVGDTLGTNTITGQITGAAVNITTVTVPGEPSTISRVSPDSQQIVAGAALTLTVQTADRFGNGVPGVAVTWTSSGGTLSTTTTTSGATGSATENFQTDPAPGVYYITAAVPGKASIVFTVSTQ